uniref:DUF7751 domain-containing protein n=2 Tax=Triticum urartu TaxID=4572 RepID=A0A8R7P851_TRIUA
MEQRSLLASAVGMGVGVGLGLASARWAKPAHAADGGSGAGAGAAEVEAELRRLVVDGRDSEVTFDEFHHRHCYLSEQTKEVLISAAFVHLKQADLSKHIRNLSAASRAILLSGPTEAYLQSLAKALSHYYKARLLLLDVTDFSLRVSNRRSNSDTACFHLRFVVVSHAVILNFFLVAECCCVLQIQSKYGGSSKALVQNQSASETTFGRVSDFIGSFAMFPKKDEPRESLRRQTSSADSRARGSDVASNDPLLRKNASMPSDMSDVASQCSVHSARRASSWSFDEKVLIQSLYKVMISVAESDPIILYIRDVDHFLHRSQRTYSMFQRMLAKLSGQVLILGSRLLNSDAEYSDVDDRVSTLFPYHVDIKPPQEEIHLNGWKTQMEEDARKIQIQDNRNHIVEVLSANDLDCDDLSSICQADTMVLSNYIEEIIVSAVSYHLVHTNDPEYKNGKLLLSSKSLSHGLSIFQETGLGGKDTLKLEANEDGLKGAPGSKKPENDKSPGKDGDAPPQKPVSSIQFACAFRSATYLQKDRVGKDR